ncbi:hypothetical protein G9U53_26260 [Rhodococcus sp. D-46]|uniref:hypothetical protein n=1 Tax=Rhodococcus sp. D-46 TaxID=2716265 RepID=UPI0013F5FB17|nr:hypothetical protein [Rhodococcus sp. D-46]
MSKASRNPSVTIRLPEALAKSNFIALFTEMGLNAVPGDTPGEWILREAVSARRWTGKRLVEVRTLAAPWLRDTKFDLLKPPPQDLPRPAVTAEDVTAEREEITRRMSAPQTIVPLLYGTQLDVVLATDADLEEAVEQQYETLRTFPEEGPPVFPDLAVSWISVDHKIYFRYKLPAFVMRFEQDADLAHRIQAGGVDAEEESSFFASNQAIAGPGLLDDTYLGPLLSCTVSDIWAVHGQRLGNTIIYVLGTAISGVDSMPAEPLQLLPRHAASKFRPHIETSSPEAWTEAIYWWATKLDQMFTYLSSPVTFTDANGFYLPYQHQNWMLNTEELFNRTSSAMMAWRDIYSGQIMTNSALDLVSEVFLGTDMSELCDPKRARKVLDRLESTMPAKVREVLLPRARAGVHALSTIADGFFITNSRGTGTVDIIDDNGDIEHLEVGKAVAAVMRGRRNATHGFGGKTGEVDRNARVLAHHDGTLPDDLTLLPYLYLLSVLNQPDTVRLRIERNSRRQNRKGAGKL